MLIITVLLILFSFLNCKNCKNKLTAGKRTAPLLHIFNFRKKTSDIQDDCMVDLYSKLLNNYFRGISLCCILQSLIMCYCRYIHCVTSSSDYLHSCNWFQRKTHKAGAYRQHMGRSSRLTQSRDRIQPCNNGGVKPPWHSKLIIRLIVRLQ